MTVGKGNGGLDGRTQKVKLSYSSLLRRNLDLSFVNNSSFGCIMNDNEPETKIYYKSKVPKMKLNKYISILIYLQHIHFTDNCLHYLFL